MKNKQILIDTKKTLMALRESFVKELELKQEFLNDKDGRIKKLASIGEQMVLLSQIQDKTKTLEEQRDNFKKLSEKIKG